MAKKRVYSGSKTMGSVSTSEAMESHAVGFLVGFLAARGFIDIVDEKAQPGVTKAYKEALHAMGPGWRAHYHKAVK